MIMQRREFFAGLSGLLVAPSIIHTGNAMPVSTRLMRFTERDRLRTAMELNIPNRPCVEMAEFFETKTIVAVKTSPLDGKIILLSNRREVFFTGERPDDDHGLGGVVKGIQLGRWKVFEDGAYREGGAYWTDWHRSVYRVGTIGA